MPVILNREAFVTPLVEMPLPRRPVVGIVSLGVSQRQPLAKPRHAAIDTRPDNQMPMVGHQAVGKQLDVAAAHGVDEDSFKGLVIDVLVKTGCSSVCPVQHVVKMAGDVNARGSSHKPNPGG